MFYFKEDQSYKIFYKQNAKLQQTSASIHNLLHYNELQYLPLTRTSEGTFQLVIILNLI